MDSIHVGLLLAAGLATFLAFKGRKKPKYPPRPPSDPLIGHLRVLPFKNREAIFHAWAKEYGECLRDWCSILLYKSMLTLLRIQAMLFIWRSWEAT